MQYQQQQFHDPLFAEYNYSEITLKDCVIIFDGGTPCNIPRLGYGIGYGSFKVNDQPIKRVVHGVPMSNNAAEIATFLSALKYLENDLDYLNRHNIRITAISDSQIALKWIARRGGARRVFSNRKKSHKSSPAFLEAINNIRHATSDFGDIVTVWKPREHIFKIFGH